MRSVWIYRVKFTADFVLTLGYGYGYEARLGYVKRLGLNLNGRWLEAEG